MDAKKKSLSEMSCMLESFIEDLFIKLRDITSKRNLHREKKILNVWEMLSEKIVTALMV